MKSVLLFLSLVCIVNQVLSKDLKESVPSFRVISDEFDASIEKGKYIIEGQIIDVLTGKVITQKVEIQVVNGDKSASKNGQFKLTIPIEKTFVAFNKLKYQRSYFEYYEVKDQHRIKVYIYMNKEGKIPQITEEKPVIYAYSDTSTNFELKLLPKGDLTFTYPLLSNDNTWKMTTTSTGTLLSEKGEEFPYLFWEAKQDANIQFIEQKDVLNGSVLSKKEVLPYLDSVLTLLAFNPKEKTDFITYWVPRLVQKEYCFVQFQTQDLCNQFAEYEIQPKPSAFNRLYLLFSTFDTNPNHLKVEQQDLTPFSRHGFYLIEWGGIEVNEHDLIKNL